MTTVDFSFTCLAPESVVCVSQIQIRYIDSQICDLTERKTGVFYFATVPVQLIDGVVFFVDFIWRFG